MHATPSSQIEWAVPMIMEETITPPVESPSSLVSPFIEIFMCLP